MSQGSLFIDIDGTSLSSDDCRLLEAPEVSGLILFGRNTPDAEQTRKLTAAIHDVRDDLIVGIDQEGGRVQRLRKGVTRLPPCGALGRLYRVDPEQALVWAGDLGYLMALEMREQGVDLSFAPVLDIDFGRNEIIGDRAFGTVVDEVVRLASAWVKGMVDAGMAATGKHFPGHGWTVADTHLDIALDDRSMAEIRAKDLKPFKSLIDSGLQGIMPAHVVYSNCDATQAGFSEFWLQDVLRNELGFEGVIFSDDLAMKAAVAAGSYRDRAHAAIVAGCNVLLPCNNRAGQLEVLEYLRQQQARPLAAIAGLKGREVIADEFRRREAQQAAAILWERFIDE